MHRRYPSAKILSSPEIDEVAHRRHVDVQKHHAGSGPRHLETEVVHQIYDIIFPREKKCCEHDISRCKVWGIRGVGLARNQK